MFTELKGDFDSAVAGKKLLLKFHATWCGPCKAIEPTLLSIQNETGVEIISIDIEEHSKITDKLGVHSVPTVIAMDNGTAVGFRVGALAKQSFVDLVNELGLPARPAIS